ncbi:uncharacterized protein LOC141638049 [Silene latifolia]|uniref:uncharacterized protein LOC141638049 n=1 Tax=Silene latifolia TaxID=37657 RepID=UPI003D77DB7A
METISRCLDKRIEFDSSSDSDNNSTNSSHPGKRPGLRRIHEFKTAKELEDLKSVAAEVIELKDYAEWFISRSQHNVDDILEPDYYSEWFSTLDPVAKANVILYPSYYSTWFNYRVKRRGEPRTVYEMETNKHKNKIYGELALAHFNKTRDSSEAYEYRWQWEVLEFEEFVHLNFYARLKVSESRLEPGPEQLFFAEVRRQNEVTRCCILDSEEFDNSDIRHPPDFECFECMEFNEVCCSGCACGDE